MMYKLLVGAAVITTAFGKGKGKVDCSTLAQDVCTGKCEWAADGEGVEACMKAAKGGKGGKGEKKPKKEKPAKVDCATLTVEADCTAGKKCAWTADDLGSGTCAKGGKGKGPKGDKEKKDKPSKEDKKAKKDLDRAEKGKGKGKKGPKGEDSSEAVDETDETNDTTEEEVVEETEDITEDGRRRLMQRLNM